MEKISIPDYRDESEVEKNKPERKIFNIITSERLEKETEGYKNFTDLDDSEKNSLESSVSKNVEANHERIKFLFKEFLSGRFDLGEYMLTYEEIENNRDIVLEALKEFLSDPGTVSKFLTLVEHNYFSYMARNGKDIEIEDTTKLIFDLHNYLLDNYKDKPETPCFLNLRLEYTDRGLHNKEGYMSRSRKIPFKVSGDTYAWIVDNNMYFAPITEELEKMIEDYDRYGSSRFSREYESNHELGKFYAKEFEKAKSYIIDKFVSNGMKSPFIPEDDKTYDGYIVMMEEGVRLQIEKEFNFSVTDLDIKEQFYFLNYLKKVTIADSEKVKDFTSNHGVNGMRTFLSLERGDESLGDDIVEFGQNFTEADKIFSYYNELLDSADNAENLVKETIDCDSIECSAFIEQVRENILNRAQKDLEKAVRAQDFPNLEQSLGNYVSEAKEYVALLQEVGNSNIEKISANALSEADKKSMTELLIKNYETISPGEDQVDFREAVLSSLINSFDNPNTEFIILRDKDKIVSFNRFDIIVDEEGSEITYFGSFNADPAYSGVGGVVLEETIKDRLKDGRPMQAHTDPSQPITKKYINSGFVVTKIENNYAETGRMIFEIWQSPDVNNILKTKQAGDDKLLGMIGSEDDKVTVREQRENDKYEEIDSGMVLTRYIKDKNKTYLVFEKYTFGAKEDGVDNENKLKEKEAA